MPLTTTRISPDWPCQVKMPGTYDWERSAARWLRELIPARYGSYPAMIRHPVLLARHAQIQVHQEIRVARTALQTARAELPVLGLPESVIEHTIKLYAAEVMQLQHIARSVRAVSEALDCSVPAVHSNNPPSRMARHSGRKIPAINPNSTVAAPLRSYRRRLAPIIAAAPLLFGQPSGLPSGCRVASTSDRYNSRR